MAMSNKSFEGGGDDASGVQVRSGETHRRPPEQFACDRNPLHELNRLLGDRFDVISKVQSKHLEREFVSFVRTLKGAAFSGIGSVERLFKPGSIKPLPSIVNFLLLQYPGALGTAIHATPLIPALREAVPGCQITVAASGLALEVFRNNPGIDRLIETPSPLNDLKGAIASLRLQKPFRGETFATLTSVGNERTVVGLQGLFSGTTLRVGFTLVPQLYRVALDIDPLRSLIDNNLRIIEALGHPSRHFEPQMFFSDADLSWARRTLSESSVQTGQMVAVFVTQTSVTQRKSWRRERFQAAANFLIEQYGAHILFVGTLAEAKAIDSLREGISHPASTSSVAGKTTLPQLAALLSLCSIGLTLDTGTLHVARTVNLPMVIIAPAWSPVLEWLPLNNPRYRILKNADMATCPPNYIIDEVSIDEVKIELKNLIDAYAGETNRSLAT
jgi:ADP-heptose:LPS heptosyltransferase